jgi:DNA-binding HxlR family transcriptional regulator
MVSTHHDPSQVDLDDLRLTTDVLGGRWKSTILACLARRPYRFGELRRAVGGISEKVLIQSLRDLEAERLISRTVEAVVPPRVEYAMTAHGRSLCDLVVAMAEWGRHHRSHRSADVLGDCAPKGPKD